MNKFLFKTISVAISILFLSAFAIAEENSDFAEKARDRRYVGGADESDLKVQKAVTNSKAKPVEESDESNEGF